jgi:ABC-2 type transport system ATP-binding protein
MAAAIEISGATRRFGAVVAVDQLSLEIPKAETFALVGPDGAGKTTLMRLICGALVLDEGSIHVDGVDVVANTAAVQAAVGYMPQRFSLYPDLSVIENLRFYGDIFGVARDEFKNRSTRLLEDFSLEHFAGRLAEQLSGGMKQKLALACTLIHSPSTLLLDEPTAGVDPVSRREFWRILRTINARGTTIFVSTPYMDEAERTDRVAFLAHGKVLTTGTPAQLKSSLQGNVVEIRCNDRAAARHVLHEDPMVRSVEIFGDTLHALVGSAKDAIPEMERRLAAAHVASVQLSVIAPSLEDVFVERLAA